MKKIFKGLTFLLILCLGLTVPTNIMYKDAIFAFSDNELGLSSKSAVVIDEASGKVIFEHNADSKLPVASMSKTMTMLLVLDAAKSGQISLDDTTIISEHAASQEGSECFLDAHKSYRVYDLLRAVVIASANDASVALAEHVAGTEDLFARQMNDRAKELGLENTVFKNSTGLHIEGGFSSVRDISKIMRELIKYPTYTQLASVWMDQLVHEKGRVTELVNTNRLIKDYRDCDAGKTGFTDEARYCLVATARRGGTRLIACVAGANNTKTRFEETTKLFNYGFSNFESKQVIDSKKPIGEIAIKGGKQETTKIYPSRDVYSLEKRGSNQEIITEIYLEQTYPAPVLEGQVVGKLEVYSGGVLIEEIDLVAKETVAKESYKDALKNVIDNFGRMSNTKKTNNN